MAISTFEMLFPTVTVHTAFFLLPSAANAVILTVPSFTPFTTPLLDTVATFLFELFHATALNDPFLGAVTLAFNFSVEPIPTTVLFLFKVTFLTAFFTTLMVIDFFFLLFFLEITVTFVAPTFLPFTTPFFDTVATLLFDTLYLTALLAFLFGLTLTTVDNLTDLPFAT